MEINMYDSVYTAGIQKVINQETGLNIACDGNFGPISTSGLKALQTKFHIPVTGSYDQATFNIVDPLLRAKFLTMDSFTQVSNQLGIGIAEIRTVCGVESSGRGFLPDGRITILFERHQFLKALTAKYPAQQVSDWQAQNSDIINSTPGGYIGGANEYTRYNRAVAIDQECANYATSTGLFQTMGFNCSFCGFDTATDQFSNFSISETNQLLGFSQFLQNYQNGICLTALQNHDWATFALHYNGSRYAENQYDTKLADNYTKFQDNPTA